MARTTSTTNPYNKDNTNARKRTLVIPRLMAFAPADFDRCLSGHREIDDVPGRPLPLARQHLQRRGQPDLPDFGRLGEFIGEEGINLLTKLTRLARGESPDAVVEPEVIPPNFTMAQLQGLAKVAPSKAMPLCIIMFKGDTDGGALQPVTYTYVCHDWRSPAGQKAMEAWRTIIGTGAFSKTHELRDMVEELASKVAKYQKVDWELPDEEDKVLRPRVFPEHDLRPTQYQPFTLDIAEAEEDEL
jgi:hypothetical protein